MDSTGTANTVIAALMCIRSSQLTQTVLRVCACRTRAAEKLSEELRKSPPAGAKRPAFSQTRVRCCIYGELSPIEQVMVSSSLNVVSAFSVKETVVDRLNTLLRLLEAHNKERPQERHDPTTVSFGELCNIGSLRKPAEGGAADSINAHVFKRSIYNTFHFAQIYGPDVIQNATLEPITGEPDEAMLNFAFERLHQLPYLLKYVELEQMKSASPAYVAHPSFATFVYSRLIFCRDITKNTSHSSNKVKDDDPRFYKYANTHAAGVAGTAAAVYMVWVHTLGSFQNHLGTRTAGKSCVLPADSCLSCASFCVMCWQISSTKSRCS